MPSNRDLTRKVTAEAVGTAFLVAVVVGSGIYAQRLSPDDIGLQLLENSLATAGGLAALILAFGSVSGAHFNPVVSLADRVFGGLTTRDLAAYIPAQIVGGCAGAVVANLMFELPAVTASTHARDGSGLWLGEVVATMGLVLVIFGVARSGRAASAPFAVAGYIGAAYWFTSSTSFANPAVTIGRTLSDTFAGIKPSSAPAFIAAQFMGGVLAITVARFLYPEVPMPDLDDLSIEQKHALRTAAIHLRHEFDGTFGTETIEQFLYTSYDQFATNAAVHTYLPLVAERFARQRLRALAKVEGKADHGVPIVLFLCTHNAGRSQMALGWFNRLAAGRAVAWSGGSEPGKELNPSAILAMGEVGIDITEEFPKPWTDEIVRAADVVVTMGCGDACPLFPDKRYEDWDLADPTGQDLERVRPIRDEIELRVRGLLESLGVPVPPR